jgi:PTS system ascorbate-specific IIA component
MSALAGVLADDEGLARLRAAQTPDEVLATLHELAQAAAV